MLVRPLVVKKAVCVHVAASSVGTVKERGAKKTSPPKLVFCQSSRLICRGIFNYLLSEKNIPLKKSFQYISIAIYTLTITLKTFKLQKQFRVSWSFKCIALVTSCCTTKLTFFCFIIKVLSHKVMYDCLSEEKLIHTIAILLEITDLESHDTGFIYKQTPMTEVD